MTRGPPALQPEFEAQEALPWSDLLASWQLEAALEAGPHLPVRPVVCGLHLSEPAMSGVTCVMGAMCVAA
jgi:hypothetical protein